MQESLQSKIEMLIRQLSEEVRNFSSFHQAELSGVREGNAIVLQNLNQQFEKRLLIVNSSYQLKIEELETEIDYLKELNMAQRMMMEDNLGYIKCLEEKITAKRPQE